MTQNPAVTANPLNRCSNTCQIQVCCWSSNHAESSASRCLPTCANGKCSHFLKKQMHWLTVDQLCTESLHVTTEHLRNRRGHRAAKAFPWWNIWCVLLLVHLVVRHRHPWSISQAMGWWSFDICWMEVHQKKWYRRFWPITIASCWDDISSLPKEAIHQFLGIFHGEMRDNYSFEGTLI